MPHRVNSDLPVSLPRTARSSSFELSRACGHERFGQAGPQVEACVYRSNLAMRLDVSQRWPPIFCTSA
jgi:hypothetical protein